MQPHLRAGLLRYGLAFVGVLLALGGRLALDPLLGDYSRYPSFYIVVLLTARFCGTGPATMVMVLGALASAYYLVPSRGNDALQSVEFITGMVLYLGVCLTIIVLCKLLHIAQRRAMEEHRRLEVEQELLRQTLELLERDRRLVAYEIHDGLIQYATAALMHIEAAIGQTPSPDIEPTLEVARELLRKTVEEGRRLVNGIRPLILDESGLIAAIESLAAEYQGTKPEVEFVTKGDLGRLTSTLETALFRITQEALTNARKHSLSEKVRVLLEKRNERIRLEVQDWGVGFDPKKEFKRIHGLKGMEERVRLLGGQFNLETSPGKGTRLVVEFPFLAGSKPERHTNLY